MVSKKEIITIIQQFLLERGVVVEADKLDSYDFVTQGALDSFETLTLMVHLEDELNISIPPDRLVAGKNTQIGRFAALLVTLQNDNN